MKNHLSNFVVRIIPAATICAVVLAGGLTCHAEVTSAEYIRLRDKWMPTARQWSQAIPDQNGLVYYGTGGHEHWAVQAHCTAFAAVAVLATAPELDEQLAGESREQLRQRALDMFRYALRTHKSGDMPCTSGKSWGYSWISALALERISHAVTAL